jgi:cbb3-type cytochrome oxidase maturation protein
MDVTFYLFFVSLLVAFAAWCIFLWAIRTGQFHDVEEIKFQVWPKPPIEARAGVADVADGADVAAVAMHPTRNAATGGSADPA